MVWIRCINVYFVHDNYRLSIKLGELRSFFLSFWLIFSIFRLVLRQKIPHYVYVSRIIQLISSICCCPLQKITFFKSRYLFGGLRLRQGTS